MDFFLQLGIGQLFRAQHSVTSAAAPTLAGFLRDRRRVRVFAIDGVSVVPFPSARLVLELRVPDVANAKPLARIATWTRIAADPYGDATHLESMLDLGNPVLVSYAESRFCHSNDDEILLEGAFVLDIIATNERIHSEPFELNVRRVVASVVPGELIEAAQGVDPGEGVVPDAPAADDCECMGDLGSFLGVTVPGDEGYDPGSYGGDGPLEPDGSPVLPPPVSPVS